MADSLQLIKQKIIDHPYFQKTKSVIEKTPCHDNESVHDHLLATVKRAEEATKGQFISNEKAKVMFNQWMDEEKFEMKYKEIAILTALLHDIGKVLTFKENGKELPLVVKKDDGWTVALDHEYWGSTIVPKILTDVGIAKEIAEYSAAIIKLHGTFFYKEIDPSQSLNEQLSYVKSFGQGFEKEILFNVKADVATCDKFKDLVRITESLFDTPTFYEKREYFVA